MNMESVSLAILQAAPAQPSVFEAFLPMAIVFGIFYVLVIGPSRKKQAELEKLLKALKAGDRVILASGIYGVIEGVEETVVYVRIADKTKIRVRFNGIDAPEIHYQDTLSNTFPDRFPELAADHFDVILANPPFKGSLDYEDVHASLLSKVKTKKTELLFVTLILRMLKLGGRCAMVVPDGVLFGSSKAHVALRKMLVDDNQLKQALLNVVRNAVESGALHLVLTHPDVAAPMNAPTAGAA